MADDYNNRQSSSLNIFSKVEVEPELLESCDESDDSRIEMKFVEENVMVKREENNLFVSNSDEDGGDEDCYKNEGIFPDFMEPSEINSTVTVSMDPFKCGKILIFFTLIFPLFVLMFRFCYDPVLYNYFLTLQLIVYRCRWSIRRRRYFIK